MPEFRNAPPEARQEIPTGDSREVKESTLDRLERRVLAVRDTYREITAIRADVSPEEAAESLDGIWQRLLARFPAAVRSDYERYKEVSQQIEAINKEDILEEEELFARLRREHPEASEEELEDFRDQEGPADFLDELEEESDTKLGKLVNECEQIQKNQDILFLEQADKSIAALRKKFAAVRAYKDDPKSLMDFLKQSAKGGAPISEGTVKEMIFGAFDVFVTLDEDWFIKNVNPTADGVHYSGFPVSILKDGSRNQDWDPADIRHHEQVHNFLDHSEFHGSRYAGFEQTVNRWANRVKSYLRLGELEAPDHILKGGRELIEYFDASRIIDSDLDEWLAAMEDAENQAFMQESKTMNRLVFLMAHKEASELFSKAIPSLSTAQNRVVYLMEYLEEKLRGVKKDEYVQQIITNLRRDVSEQFYAAAKQMQTALDIGRRLGVEADEFAHFAFVIFKPSQFVFVETLLRHRYGSEPFEKAKQAFSLIDGLGETPESVIRAEETLEKDPHAVEKNDLSAMATILTNMAMGSEGFGLGDDCTLQEMRKYKAAFERLFEIFRANGIETEDRHFPGIDFRFFTDALDVIAKTGKAVPEAWNNLTDEERADLIGALEMHVYDGYLLEDLSVKFGKKRISRDDVYSSTFWQAVEMVGATEQLRPLVEEGFPPSKRKPSRLG